MNENSFQKMYKKKKKKIKKNSVSKIYFRFQNIKSIMIRFYSCCLI